MYCLQKGTVISWHVLLTCIVGSTVISRTVISWHALLAVGYRILPHYLHIFYRSIKPAFLVGNLKCHK